MAILYKKYKLERTLSDGRKDPANGKWFARAVSLGTVDVEQLAKLVSYSTTATEADCRAVIESFISEINAALMDSYTVKIDGLGIFKAAIRSTGAVERDEFSVAKNIIGKKVLFMPTRSIDAATNQVTKHLVAKPQFKETPEYE